jgi:hypothetical protein
MRHDDA